MGITMRLLTAFFAKNKAGTLYFSNISSAVLLQRNKSKSLLHWTKTLKMVKKTNQEFMGRIQRPKLLL